MEQPSDIDEEFLKMFMTPFTVEFLPGRGKMMFQISYESGEEIIVTFKNTGSAMLNRYMELCEKFIGPFMTNLEQANSAEGEMDDIVKSFYTMFSYFSKRTGIEASRFSFDQPEEQTSG